MCVGGGGLCRQNICYHVAAYLIPFNLICNMTLCSEKVAIWPFDPTHQVHPGGQTQTFDIKSRLVYFIFIVPLNFSKNIDN